MAQAMKLSRFFQKRTPGLFAFVKGMRLLYINHSYLVTSGLMESYRRGYPCKADGTAVPWMNYSLITLLEERLTKDVKLLEFGSGYSTLFFSRLMGSVTSIESAGEWFETTSLARNNMALRQMVGDSADLFLVESTETESYRKILEKLDDHFDVILIDGKNRVSCALLTSDMVTERGVILFDDSMREEYKEGIDHLVDRGFKQLDFEGVKPTSIKLYRTSVFYRPDNCLGL